MSNIFFTSDTHWSHKNIIKYCNRPFSSVEEMDEKLIENWNSVVKPGDRVYHLGDFGWGDPLPILKRLNGQKYLILGNHDDYKDHENAMKWNWIKNYFELKVNDQIIVLGHYGQRVWNKMRHGSYMAYGHSHGKLPPYGRSRDVGVDCWNYFPLSIEDFLNSLKNVDPIIDGDDKINDEYLKHLGSIPPKYGN